MRAPKYWYDTTKPIPYGLKTASQLYRFFSRFRIEAKPTYRAPLPVICVGNVVMGGSGKTPVVQALARIFADHGLQPAILLRGYGGSAAGPLWVTNQTAKEIGDEALLHVAHAPTVISRDRIKGAQTIEGNPRITHIIMDDGLQNPALDKIVSLLVVNGEEPFGNGHIFPAGPLREPLDAALKRCHALVILGEDKHHLLARYQFTMPVFKAKTVAHLSSVLPGAPVIAFAGLGNNEKFFTTLAQTNHIFEAVSFPDHHLYNEKELRGLLDKAQKANMALVTTRKDWVRLPKYYQDKIQVLDITLQWHNESAVVLFLHEKGLI